MSPQVEVLDEFITSPEMARLFSRTELTILNWRQNNGLPYVVIPGAGLPAIRFRLEHVLPWAAANRKDPEPSILDELLSKTRNVAAGSQSS